MKKSHVMSMRLLAAASDHPGVGRWRRQAEVGVEAAVVAGAVVAA